MERYKSDGPNIDLLGSEGNPGVARGATFDAGLISSVTLLNMAKTTHLLRQRSQKSATETI